MPRPAHLGGKIQKLIAALELAQEVGELHGLLLPKTEPPFAARAPLYLDQRIACLRV